MRVHKYEAELDNGQTMNISGAKNDTQARQIAERALSRPRYEGASSVKSVRVTKRGIWG